MSTRDAREGIHAYAALPTGVHAIPLEQAVAQVQRITMPDAEKPTPAGPSPVWIDITRPGETETVFLRDQLGFHPLAVEDCIRGRQRPKLDRFPGYLFIVFYAARINPERDRVALNEIHLFLGEHFIVTVRDETIREVTEIIARWRARPDHFTDVGALAHALLDAIVDDYFGVLDHFAERTERIESAVFQENASGGMEQIFQVRRELVHFRRVVGPERDVVSLLLRRELPFLRPEMLLYFQDVHDHTLRVMEEIDALREVLSASREAHLSVASHQLNQTMRMLTGWSIILMSMALVAGIYGMNFVFMPELEWRWGYFGALTMMVLLGIALVTFFRRRRWL
ncbi:MAG: magnesium/cobalt transporter CorA [Longimicrobiaceae bacterium]